MSSGADWKSWLTGFPRSLLRGEHPYNYAKRLLAYLADHPPFDKLTEPERTALLRLLNRRRADLAGMEYKAARSRLLLGGGVALLTTASVPFGLLLPAVGLSSLLFGLNEIRASQVNADTGKVIEQLKEFIDRIVDEIEFKP